MDRHLIVPGYTNSGPENWQSHWQEAWGSDAVRIQPASWDHPDLDDWVAAVEKGIGRLELGRRDRLVLVAHSLGTWASVEYLRRAAESGRAAHPLRATVAFLVAPPDPRGENFPAAAPSFAHLTAHPLPCPALVVASDDDPYCDVVTSRRLALGWGARWTGVGSLGHINSESQLGMWEQGQMLLAGLR